MTAVVRTCMYFAIELESAVGKLCNSVYYMVYNAVAEDPTGNPDGKTDDSVVYSTSMSYS